MQCLSSVSDCLVLSCTAKCSVQKEICRQFLDWKILNLREGQEDRPVSTLFPAWYGAVCLITKLSCVWTVLLERGDESVA